MRYLLAIAALAWAPVSATVSAQENTAPSAVDWANVKYEWAVIGEHYAEKCQKFSDFFEWSITEAKKSYAAQLDAAGYGESRKAFNEQMRQGFAFSTCEQVRQEQRVSSALNNLAFLGDEFLLAIHFAGVTSCGAISETKMAKLGAYLTGAVPKIQKRPDYAFIEPVAQEHGAKIKEQCESFIAGNMILLMATEEGTLVLKAADHFNNMGS